MSQWSFFLFFFVKIFFWAAPQRGAQVTLKLFAYIYIYVCSHPPHRAKPPPTPSHATHHTKPSHPQHQHGDGRAGICAFFFFRGRGPEKKKHGTQPDRHHTEPSHPPHQAKPPPTPPKQAGWGPKKNFYKKKQKKRAATLFSLLFSWKLATKSIFL